MENSSQVWVVDDDPDDQYLVQRMFHDLNPSIRVKPLFDGSDLLPCLEETTILPSLILLDLNMNRMSGFDALRQVRASPVFGDLPVIVLTTSTSEVDKEKSIRLGANQFLSKPARIQDFSVMVRQLVEEWEIIDLEKATYSEAVL